MSQTVKLFMSVLSGVKDNGILFGDLCKILEYMGFVSRIKGSHHIYCKEGIDEILNIQPNGKFAKAYQVKQVRNVILKYKLGVTDDV